MNTIEFIVYVDDQARARDFYSTVLDIAPALDVEGITEFDLGGATLGLMPAHDMAQLLDGGIDVSGHQRCEIYLRRPDAAAALARAQAAGGTLLAGMSIRPWGETVGYALDPDGHVLALALHE
jgi:predicted enzyme related to lactoylglutathione lyase